MISILFLLKEKRCKTILDVAFLIDSSGSIRPKDWINMRTFIKQVVEAIDVSQDGSHVAAISYSSTPTVDFKFNSFTGAKLNPTDINLKIDSIRHKRHYTYIDRALKLANQELFTTAGGMRDSVKKVKKKKREWE